MKFAVRVKTCVGVTLALGVSAWLVSSIVSCGSAPTPFIVQGPGVTGNQPPELSFVQPNANVSLALGTNFVVEWNDRDRDSSALVSLWVVNGETGQQILLEANIQENEEPSLRTFSTDLLPVGRYNVLGVIDDGLNPPVSVFAVTTATNADDRVVLNITPPGQGPQTVPPVITVTKPSFNLSVTQEDVLTVSVQPTAIEPADGTPPFDPDSDMTLYILLDTDLDPNNDDPANPDPSKIIVLHEQIVTRTESAAIERAILIDLDTIPPRAAGEPYYIRATADDLTNPRVHEYAVGAISVVQLATGSVDLFNIGRTTSGVRFYGFTPSASLGSAMSHIGDFDADGTDDFVLVAQFGNPRNFGPVGEAYGIYGQPGTRFGGALSVNSVGQTLSGVIFPAPRVRWWQIPDPNPRTEGITDVSFINDLTGDGRPEIMFGLSHVHGAFDTTDWDPDDADIASSDATVDIELVIRQRRVQTTVGDTQPTLDLSYIGVDDLTISSLLPNERFGASAEVSWVDNAVNVPGDREWALIKFADVLRLIPDGPENIDVQGIRATLELRVFRTGGNAVVRQCFTDFDELTTFATFAANGQEPEEGVDYAGGTLGALANVDGGTPEVVTLDVSRLVRELVDGLLTNSDDELRVIVVPDAEDGTVRTAVRSSEATIELDRPTLRITYTRTGFVGAFDCYPDDLVNNLTSEGDDLDDDLYFYGGGMVTVVNSQNRDIFGAVADPIRLESTVVDLELVGVRVQETIILDGQITVRADNSLAGINLGNESGEEDRISGFRIIPGGFDFIDARFLNQPAREGMFGQTVASLGDQNSDGLDEIMISAPRNERYLADLLNSFGARGTHLASTRYRGSITVLPGDNYNNNDWRDRADGTSGTSTIPYLDQHTTPPFGSCSASDPFPRHTFGPVDRFSIFAEEIDDWLGGASSAGDFNQDGLDDILCGAPGNDRAGNLQDTGAVYVLYGRNVIGDFRLNLADDPILRAPMLRIRGSKPGDQIGWTQSGAVDVNGDRIEDIFISSPTTDFGGIARTTCARDFNGDGTISAADFNAVAFDQCEAETELFSDDACKVFDYNNDGDVDAEDNSVFNCLREGGGNCCANLVDNGFVGIIFGGVFTDGDRTIDQIATSDLPGTVFFGSSAGDRAGLAISSAGDFNKDGFGDILVAVPGETRLDRAGRKRLGVVYLIFGGTHLINTSWNLSEVGSEDLPGIVFLSPYVKGRPNEAAPVSVAFIGDINSDGFGDIAIGNPKADFVDLSFPQGPDATDSQVGRRSNAGDVYIIYGNNFGSNRGGGS